ncbi:hypothetical protein HDV57DRAFT_503923 [Trichoderma longibrachiatum]|uniref:Uncharacterized protein n=1 Tax=Trichoderma longibrachiatum ATCC 18648 TaxID=983965 RepID=A0A2T4CEB4_TRILO|nr:hypothetical protein M440DRAFT_1397158 [Trichoderma longibrachiatum ATCC 18648]
MAWHTPKELSGAFHAHKPPSEPMTKGGHKPGVKVGNDRFPESHLETYPPGTAPEESSYRPNPISEIPGQANNPDVHPEARSDPLDFPGATSQDVHEGPGKPLQGQEGREKAAQLPGKKHTDSRVHPRGRKKEGDALGTIAAEADRVDPVREHGWDLPEGIHKGMKGKASDDWPTASERVPEAPDHVAAEMP